ncbi:MAG: aspartate/glutamate racemase family protein [Geminicoccaceae bacterium]
MLAAMPDRCRISSVFLENGPGSVESAVDEALAAPGVIDAALRAERDGADAVVIDCMLDPGLDAARESVSIPVIGCGEASMSAAAKAGAFSVITVLDRQARAFCELARRYGLADHLRSVRGIGVPVLALESAREESITATLAESKAAVQEDGAAAIVFGCTGMLGFAQPVADGLGHTSPVIDPLPHATLTAHKAVLAGERTDKAVYPSPEPKRVTGFAGWRMLDAMMRGEAGE